MATLAEVLARDSQRLRQVLDLDLREARLEIQILLCHVLGVARSWLIGHDRDELAEPAEQTYSILLERRLAGEPIAYIVGSREFFGLEFLTTPAVLIPRPETELLVELALARIPESQPCKVLDLGTGSGAIAISLARNRPLTAVTAVEQSEEALVVARENAARLRVPNLHLLRSNWFDALDAQTFDLIVSNPPYVEAADPHLQQGDLRFEPRQRWPPGQMAWTTSAALSLLRRTISSRAAGCCSSTATIREKAVARFCASMGFQKWRPPAIWPGWSG